MTPLMMALLGVLMMATAFTALAGMAKWKSPIFSDIRNKLGESVIFSMWKGRPYMRQYTVPANPQTNSQTARRLMWSVLVANWSYLIGVDADTEEFWNVYSLPELISGFNKYISQSIKSDVQVEATKGSGVAFNVTYTLGCPAATARLVARNHNTGVKTVIAAPGTLEAGVGKVKSCTIVGAQTYSIWISNSAVADGDDSANPQHKTLLTKWKKDLAGGTYSNAEIIIT